MATTANGNLGIAESAATNLGALALGSGNLTVVSGGAITNATGQVATTGTAALTAGTAASPLAITLGTGTASNITGTITVNVASSVTLKNNPAGTTTVATGANNIGSMNITLPTAGSSLAVSFGTGGLGTLSFNTNGGGTVALAAPGLPIRPALR